VGEDGGGRSRGAGANGNVVSAGVIGRGRPTTADDENRLIDQLEEEWDD
jgi:hypothetical protein